MAEAGTLCVNADVVKLAGIGANSTAVAEAATNVYIKMAEGFICGNSRYDWVTQYSSVSTIGKEFLRIVTASLAAFWALEYSMRGYTSRTESQIMSTMLWNQAVEGINLLRDNEYRAFILTGAGSIN